MVDKGCTLQFAVPAPVGLKLYDMMMCRLRLDRNEEYYTDGVVNATKTTIFLRLDPRSKGLVDGIRDNGSTWVLDEMYKMSTNQISLSSEGFEIGGL